MIFLIEDSRLRLFAYLFVLVLSSLQSLVEADDLKSLETRESGLLWSAVGRLAFDGDRGFCTASLIGPDIILTAAHCLYNEKTGSRHELVDFEFQAGWRNGRAEAYRKVKAALPHPQYKFRSRDKIEKVGHDIALVILENPIQNSDIVPFFIATLPGGIEDVAVVSYAKGRKNAPSIQSICSVRAKQQGILILTCDVDYGASGSPVFLITDAGAVIVSLISAMAQLDEQKVSLGVSLDRVLADLEEVAHEKGFIIGLPKLVK